MDRTPRAEGGDESPRTRDALRERAERIRYLRSAWSVLAHFGLGAETQHIVDAGRAVSEEIADLAGHPPESRDPDALLKMDKVLGALESEMRSLAFEVPVAQLRSTLPRRLPRERRGVLDLLDLLLDAELGDGESAGGRLSAIDYLITLLCTGGDGSVLEDPVGLSTKLFELCERAGADGDSRLSAVEAEFYDAANVSENDAREELQIRALRRRKRDLGMSFFAPGVLRAVVAYNAAMSRCLDRGVTDSRDWGSLAAAHRPAQDAVSVFDTDVLPQLAEALRRRHDGHAPSASAVDRIAWCLDVASLGKRERAALLTPETGGASQLEGTAMLVGLLCRSALVLGDELPAIGISPEQLVTAWAGEIDDALKRAVNDHVANNRFDAGSALTELRNTFLYGQVSEAHRDRRRVEASRETVPYERVEEEAQQLAEEAVTAEATPATVGFAARFRAWPWRGTALLGSGVALVALVAFGLAHLVFTGDVHRMRSAELERVSPYLARGGRNAEGVGPAFVGTLEESWDALSTSERQRAAEALVGALRNQGVRQVMVYGDGGGLQIQAMGQRPLQVFPPR